MMTPTSAFQLRARKQIISIGLFSQDPKLFDQKYVRDPAYDSENDFVLKGQPNLVLYTNTFTMVWLLIYPVTGDFKTRAGANIWTRDESLARRLWKLINFEEVLEHVSPEIRTQLLFHLDIFAGDI